MDPLNLSWLVVEPNQLKHIICSSNWIISPRTGVQKKIFETTTCFFCSVVPWCFPIQAWIHDVDFVAPNKTPNDSRLTGQGITVHLHHRLLPPPKGVNSQVKHLLIFRGDHKSSTESSNVPLILLAQKSGFCCPSSYVSGFSYNLRLLFTNLGGGDRHKSHFLFRQRYCTGWTSTGI